MERVLRTPAFTGTDVTIRNLTHELCGIGLWGPKAKEILSAITDADLSDAGFPYYKSREIDPRFVRARALRISYAGEYGFEFYVGAPQGALSGI